MIKLSDLIIDPKSIGATAILVEVSPWHEYDNNKKKISPAIGTRYVCALPKLGMEKIGVKIKGEAKLKLSDNLQFVKFANLELKAYLINGQITVNATADDITEVNTSEHKKQ